MNTITIPITLDTGPALEQIAALAAAVTTSMSPAAEPSAREAPAQMDIQTVTASLDKLHQTTAELRKSVGDPLPGTAATVTDTLAKAAALQIRMLSELELLERRVIALAKIVGGHRADAPSVVDTLDGVVRALVRVENRIEELAVRMNTDATPETETRSADLQAPLGRIEALLIVLANNAERAVARMTSLDERFRLR